MFPKRETLEEANKVIVRWLDEETVVLADEDDSTKREVWFQNNGHASYGIVIDGDDYEFLSSENP